jgi:ubiquinone/menaquinone biosynthesis C-methylase UbiE
MTKARYALMTAILLDLAAGLAARAIPIQATPEQIFQAARITSGQTVCEIGAGVGDLALAAARVVGADGRVFANELEWRLPALRIRVADSNLSTVTVVTGEPTKTGIPDGACDAVIMKDVYHHFVEPAAMNRAIAAALKPGGRMVIVDFTPPGKEAATPAGRGADGTHGVLPATVIAEVNDAGFRNEPAGGTTDRWYLLVFVKGPPAASLAR